MSNRYEVKPKPYTPPKIARVTTEERKQAAKVAGGNYGCGTFAVIGIVLVAGSYTIGFVQTAIGGFVLAIAYYIAARAGEINRLSAERIKNEQERIKREQASIEAEAQRLTSTLATIHNSAPTHVQNLSSCLSSAESDLAAAEHEFSDGAFAPFWDAIERAANNLSAFDHTTRQLTGQAKLYYDSLRDRDHTFPQFPVALTTLPDPTHTTKRMQVIVRQAQRNFQFATIYEQRKTNNILKHGFMSLSSAIADLGSTLQSSFDDLRDSVSTGFAGLVEQQIATRDSIDAAAAAAKTFSEEALAETRSGNKAAATNAQEQRKRDQEAAEMLDNIQRRRKPLPPKPGDGAY
jgi:hypothetical protein